MNWPTYPDLRTTAIPWLDSIPSTWQVKKFRYCFRESTEKNGATPVGEMLSVSGYRGVEVKQYDDENRRRTAEELTDYRVVRVGQLAVNTMWLNYAGLGVSAFEGHISPAYRAYWIEPGFDRRFVNYLMRSSAYVDGYTALLAGIRPNSLQMSRNDLMGFPVLCPPLEDQRWIADFLDHETAKIDALIAKQDQLIATLREDRTATITHAVTNGLDPSTKTVDAGIWLGSIPQHWSRARLRDIIVSIDSGTSVNGAEAPADPGEIGVLKTNCVTGGDGVFRPEANKTVHPEERSRVSCPVRAGTLILNRANTASLVGSAAYVREDVPDLYLSDLLWAVSVRGIEPRFLHLWMQTTAYRTQIAAWRSGFNPSMQKLAKSSLRSFVIALPPVEEQRDIVAFLKARTDQMDDLIAKADEVIATLREYRSALITDAVTGKIDVRGAA